MSAKMSLKSTDYTIEVLEVVKVTQANGAVAYLEGDQRDNILSEIADYHEQRDIRCDRGLTALEEASFVNRLGDGVSKAAFNQPFRF